MSVNGLYVKFELGQNIAHFLTFEITQRDDCGRTEERENSNRRFLIPGKNLDA